jgi:outer membrane protein TolC
LALAEAWYGHEVAVESVAIRGEVVEAARRREATLERLLAEGRAVEMQLSAVALKRAEAEQAESRARADAAVARRALGALLGRPVEASGVDLVAAARARLDHPLPEGRSSAVAEAMLRSDAAASMGKVATGALLPTLAARGSAQYSNPDLTQFPVRNEWGTYWDASLVLSWSLDAGVLWSEARAARRDAHAAELAVDAASRREDVERAGAVATVEMAGALLDVATKRVQVAERAVEVSETAALVGRATSVDTLDRRAELAMARAAELRVALDTILAVEAVRVLGGEAGPPPVAREVAP